MALENTPRSRKNHARRGSFLFFIEILNPPLFENREGLRGENEAKHRHKRRKEWARDTNDKHKQYGAYVGNYGDRSNPHSAPLPRLIRRHPSIPLEHLFYRLSDVLFHKILEFYPAFLPFQSRFLDFCGFRYRNGDLFQIRIDFLIMDMKCVVSQVI